MNYQSSLFGFQAPRAKVPISRARILEAKEAIIRGDSKTALQSLRDINDKLQNFEQRMDQRAEAVKFNYSVGAEVGYNEEFYTITQRRTYHGRPYYRLNDGKIVSENLLY
jgi:signal transduction histidine kinase